MEVIPPVPPPPDPPDPTSASPMLTEETRSASKRRMESDENGSTAIQSKKTVTSPDMAAASIQTIWHHALMVIGVKEYSTADKGPFIIHVARQEPDPAAGTTIRPIKFGQFLNNHHVTNICSDGIKQVGRNRISVEFRTAVDANKFLDNTVLLSQYKYIATIPTYNITRMGLVRNVPVDMSMEEFATSLEVPNGCGFVVKARRLNRKSNDEGKVTWIPTQSVVLTFRGQVLPQRVFSFHTSLTVEVYQLPTIQCLNCCRFGHVKAQCRSKPRCYKCAKDHTGESCELDESKASCLHCSGCHFTSSRLCPEQDRQKSIKAFMSQNGISYEESSTHFPKVGRSYAEVAQTMFSSPLSTHQDPAPLPHAPNHRSYVKNVYAKPRPRVPLGKSYDKASHQEIVSTPSSSLTNGHAFMSQPLTQESDKRQNFLIETLLSILIELCSSNNSTLPSNVAQKLSQIFSLSSNNGSSLHCPVEREKSSSSET